MLGQQKRDIESLVLQLEETRIRQDVARKTLARKRHSAFTHPASLLLPFSAGVLVTVLLKRNTTPASQAVSGSPLPVASVASVASMVSMAGAFWSATRNIRAELGWSTPELKAKALKAARSSLLNER